MTTTARETFDGARLWFGASAALALAYGVAAHVGPHAAWDFPLALLKASGVALLGFLALQRNAQLLSAALLLGALGDALLELGARPTFLAGAGAFALGHMCYIALFWNAGLQGGALRMPWRAAAMAAIALGVSSALSAFAPPPALLLPLAIYAVLLTAMALTTLTLRRALWPASIGGPLFVISDGLVALHMFAPNDDAATSTALSLLCWALYWLAQAGLCLGGLCITRTSRG